MARYIIGRFAQMIPTLVIVSAIVFFTARLMPGDPAEAMAGMDATPEEVDALRERMGLDQSLIAQYLHWLKGLFTGDLGSSLATALPVSTILGNALPVTIALTIGALLFTVVTGVPMAVIAAMNRGKAVDKSILLGSLAGVSVPSFVLGIMLILVFSVSLGWLPVSGYTSFSTDFAGAVQAFILPSISLGMLFAANITRVGRASTLEVLGEEYVTSARALGIPERRVRYRYVLKNAMIPMLTIIGITSGTLMGGTVVTERVFNLPGIGTVVINAVLRRDYPVIQATVILAVVVYLVANLVVDIAYAIFDPRVRYA